jgi:hypothetical protein
MTFDDKQQLLILEILFPYQDKHIFITELAAKTKPFIGDGFLSLIEQLIKEGLISSGEYFIDGIPVTRHISERTNMGYKITTAGINKVIFLKKYKKNERRREIRDLWTFILVLIAAIASIVGLILK